MMKKAIVINEAHYHLGVEDFNIETIICNEDAKYFVINKNLKCEKRNWQVLAFNNMSDIFTEYYDNGLDYKVNFEWRKGDVFASYNDYCKWFNNHYNSEEVEVMYVF
jgi:hypothetical protein